MSTIHPSASSLAFRPATRADLPAVLALLADEERIVDPATITVTEQYEHAFESIESDARNEMLVLVESPDAPGEGGTVVGCLQSTYIPGLGRGGGERVIIEAVRVRADRRSGGIGRMLMEQAMDRARSRGCAWVQLTSKKSRDRTHRFYERLGFEASHEGFKRAL
jgi:GNAT superfamily N-acetyltransferase